MLRDERAHRRPREVALWGIGDDTERYLGYLREAGITPAVCVDEGLAGSQFNGIDVISPTNCARQCYLYSHLPFVVTAAGCQNGGRVNFNDAVLHIANDLDLPVRLLHPVFLADHADLDYRGSVLLAGFPGAGARTVQDMIGPLVERRVVQRGHRERLFAALARDYHSQALIPTIDQLFNLGGRYVSRDSPIMRGRIQVEMELSSERFAVLCNLRSKPYLYERLHFSHEQLPDVTLRMFRRMQWTIVVVVRNPLDIIVSAAAEVSHPPAAILDTLPWFRHMAMAIREYYTALLSPDTGIHVLRWEHFLQAPVETIRTVGRIIDVDVSGEEAERLWASAGRRQMSRMENGSWPQEGLWRQYFGQRHIDLLRELEYGPFLEALGYASALEGRSGLEGEPAGTGVPLSAAGRREAAVRDFGYHVLYDKPLDFRHEGFECHRDRMLDLTMLTDDAEVWSLMKIGMSSRYVRKILLALDS